MLDHGMDPTPPVEVRHVVGITTRLARAVDATVAQLTARMLEEYGRSELYEVYKKSTVGKVCFDVDGKAADTTPLRLLADALRGVETFFGHLPARILVATSHGAGKLSFRIYVPGYRMSMADQKARIVRLKLDKNRPFDAAIYGANQKLRMAGSIKSPQDARVLALSDADGVPIDRALITAAMLADTLVQVVDPGWPLLEEALAVPETKRGAPGSAVPGQALAVLPAPKRPRGRPPADASIPADALRVLLDMHFVEPRFVSKTAEGFVFDAQNRERCPNCGHDHDRQNWWCVPKEDEYVVGNYSDRCRVKRYPKVVEAIVPAHANFEDSLALLPLEGAELDKLRGALHFHETVVKVACYRPECLACDRTHDCTSYTARELIPRHCWTVRNDDNSCRPRIFHHTARLADKLHSLFLSPNEEALIGLFLEGHAGAIHVDRHTRAVYLWRTAARGGCWEKLTSGEFESRVSSWLNTLLQGIAGLAEFKDHEKAIRVAMGKVTPGGVAKIKQQILGRISLDAVESGRKEATMDANPLLLGAGTDVIDLKARDPDTGAWTTVLRPARPEDLVTKTVGYSIPEDGFASTDAVEAVFAQIYPIEEERRFFQLYGGYCLLGNNPAKGFMCLTDRRKGDNGKSTAVRLLRRALGDDYVIDNKQNLLYEARYSNSVNAHDSGMLAFEGKRLAIMEELSANRTLDTSVMKQLTGGEARISVRAAGAADTRAMAWSAKLITVFNEGCAPRFKVEDDAFTKRMIVLPHRAFFCKDDAARSLHCGEEYTFDADGGKIEMVEAEPWKILSWFLTGLEAYWSSGHVEFQAPSACREWAGGLVQEQDEVAQWMHTYTEQRTDGYFTSSDAFRHFANVGGTVPQRVFKHRLVSVLKSHFHAQKKIEGVNRSNVFINMVIQQDG